MAIFLRLQPFNPVNWVTGSASGLKNFSFKTHWDVVNVNVEYSPKYPVGLPTFFKRRIWRFSVYTMRTLCNDWRLKNQGPTRRSKVRTFTGKPAQQVVYKLKWVLASISSRHCRAISNRPLPERTHFGPVDRWQYQVDRHGPANCTMAFTRH